jgi:hypothetical protein
MRNKKRRLLNNVGLNLCDVAAAPPEFIDNLWRPYVLIQPPTILVNAMS